HKTGVPLHAFDQARIKNGLTLDLSHNHETFNPVAGKPVDLTEGLLIQRSDNRAVDLVGVMGGYESGVSAETTNILLQAGNFSPSIVRKNSRASGISSDASYRYERGINFELLEYALGRCIEELQRVQGSITVVGQQNIKTEPPLISIRYKLGDISSLLG